MSDLAIRVENIGKRYRLGATSTMDRTFRESITESIAALFRGKRDADAALDEKSVWALRGVSFDVGPGEVVGIIGRNGAGKSTLLKVLSRITDPSEGRAIIRGRVGSLLEVGTGFHPELTGRENVFLNGAILGMTRAEIKRKFDEIIDFAEIEEFIDTPVKRYSSGMYVRLAFAVAAHLEPEILVVDEVLAVGDAAFQKKCLGKMKDVAGHGRTVLFVSHNMSSVQALCSRAVVLSRGTVILDGDPETAILNYMETLRSEASRVPLAEREDRKGTGDLRFESVEVVSADMRNPNPGMDEDVLITMNYNAKRTIRNANFGLHIVNSHGHVIYRVITRDTIGELHDIPEGPGSITCRLTQPRLLPGVYSLDLVASISSTRDILDNVSEAAQFEVEAMDFYGTGKHPDMGAVYAACEWELS